MNDKPGVGWGVIGWIVVAAVCWTLLIYLAFWA
jgi:hypothetical protein